MNFILFILIVVSPALVASELFSDKERNQLLYKSLLQRNVENWLDSSQKPIPSHIPTCWDTEEFTDPLHHKKNDFVYVITAIREFFDFKKLDSKIFGKENRVIFASLISSADTDTFRGSGVILKIYQEHVIGTSLVDTMFNLKDFSSYEEGTKFYKEIFGILTPKKMYLGSHWDKYFTSFDLKQMFNIYTMTKNNEILLHGVDVKRRPVEIIGVFIKEDQSIDDHVYKGLQDFAKTHALPVVMIPIIKPFFTPTL